MAERLLDRLLPGAGALVLGAGALAAGLGGIAADMMMGRPSVSSGVGFVLMLPAVVIAAVVGFAIGYGAGAWIKRRGMNVAVPMRPYRVVIALALGVAAVIGATLGARPVIRNERLYRPRVIAGEGAFSRQTGAPDGCILGPASVACDAAMGVTSSALQWNGRDVIVACTREGRVSVAEESGASIAVLDLSGFDRALRVDARAVRGMDGREWLALLSSVRVNGTRHLLSLVDHDGRIRYQEMLAGERPAGNATALRVCEADDPPSLVIDLSAPVTYRPR